MNNSGYTEIAFILDRSGSMQLCAPAAVEGFNRFLADQQKVEGLAKLTLALFDDEYLLPVESVPVQEVLPLDPDTFVPRGCTALLDAIGRTIGSLGARPAILPESVRPAKVITAISPTERKTLQPGSLGKRLRSRSSIKWRCTTGSSCSSEPTRMRSRLPRR